MAISVTLTDANSYEVVVDGDGETTHRVYMSQSYYRQLCGGTVTHEWVIVQAFRFLLERGPNTGILPAFDLQGIGERFPEFEVDMAERLRGG